MRRDPPSWRHGHTEPSLPSLQMGARRPPSRLSGAIEGKVKSWRRGRRISRQCLRGQVLPRARLRSPTLGKVLCGSKAHQHTTHKASSTSRRRSRHETACRTRQRWSSRVSRRKSLRRPPPWSISRRIAQCMSETAPWLAALDSRARSADVCLWVGYNAIQGAPSCPYFTLSPGSPIHGAPLHHDRCCGESSSSLSVPTSKISSVSRWADSCRREALRLAATLVD